MTMALGALTSIVASAPLTHARPITATLLTATLSWWMSAPLARPPCRHPSMAQDAAADRRLVGRPACSPTTSPATPLTTFTTPTPLVALLTGFTAVTLAAVMVMSPVLGLTGVVAVVGARVHRRRSERHRRIAARQRALPELIDVLVALIHSGLTPTLAWRELPACAPPALDDIVRTVISALDRGVPFADALGAALDDLGPAARSLFDALVTAERHGLPLVPALDRLSADAGAERRRAVEARNRQLPVRLSVPLVVCTLPAFTLLGIVPVLVATLSSLRRP